MAAEQLSFLDLEPEALTRKPSRPRARRTPPVRPPVPATPKEPAAGEVLIEHRCPEALDFLREHGPDALAVLHVLAVRAEVIDGRHVARASTRGVAEQLGFLSKDSAHRRLRQLRPAGVLEGSRRPDRWTRRPTCSTLTAPASPSATPTPPAEGETP